MLSAVLLSIQPRHVENICTVVRVENGKPIYKKQIEVRKTRPKQETPFKCYIYESKGKTKYWSQPMPILYTDGKGKVIGEFICDRIDEYRNHIFAWRDKEDRAFSVGEFLSDACLTAEELGTYVSGKSKFYGWHISELKIYDKPKELSEFKRSVKKCTNGVWYLAKETITCPPQSWGYVEE